MPPFNVPSLPPAMSLGVSSPVHQLVMFAGGAEQSKAIFVRSAEELFVPFTSLPPDTVAVLVTLAGAVFEIFTVRVMVG